ncbi:hypothetical protein MMC12_007424 [Toensbergia leucococca]|nr:hypothetical protein [Toensbergia leucococca]
MSTRFRSQHGLQALALVAVSTLFLIVFQQHHAPVLDLVQQHAAVPAHHLADQLDKRIAVPFGHDQPLQFFNRISHHKYHTLFNPLHNDPHESHDNSILLRQDHGSVHVKRADPITLTLDDAKCKGERYLALIDNAAANPQPPRWTFADLHTNGWDIDPDAIAVSPAVQQAMSTKGIPTDAGSNTARAADLKRSFLNVNNVVTPPDGGYFGSIINTAARAINARYNVSPKYCAGNNIPPPTAAEIATMIPPMNSWADVVWAIWADSAATAGIDAGSLRYIFRDTVTNVNTRFIMEQVMGVDTPGALAIPWPGRVFSTRTVEGKQLFGTPHGVGIAWLVVNGMQEFRGTRYPTITIWTRQDPPYQPGLPFPEMGYFMLFDLGS